jgi:hypothetical protein
LAYTLACKRVLLLKTSFVYANIFSFMPIHLPDKPSRCHQNCR